jgi:pantothenate kinase
VAPVGAPSDLSLLLDRVALLADAAAQDGRRRVLGVAGPPGAGKTTLVETLLAASSADRKLAGRLAHVPMDGFHLTNGALEERGLRDRKGAPDTFDTATYAAVLAAVRESPRRVVTAPAFDHSVGEPAADALVVRVTADVVVTEGNYLLLDDPDWQPVRAALDEVWLCALADDVRQARFVDRHVAAGREPDDARAWVERSDEANARLVTATATAARADLVLVDGRVLGGSEGS